MQRPRQTRTKCFYLGCDAHKPPHLRNGAPLLNSGASFWAPPCSRQREMSPYGTYAHRNGLGQEFGVSSCPSPGYFEAALGVVSWLTSLYLGKAGAAFENNDWGGLPSWPYIIASLKNPIGQTERRQNFPSATIIRLVKNNNAVFWSNFQKNFCWAPFPNLCSPCIAYLQSSLWRAIHIGGI